MTSVNRQLPLYSIIYATSLQ